MHILLPMGCWEEHGSVPADRAAGQGSPALLHLRDKRHAELTEASW